VKIIAWNVSTIENWIYKKKFGLNSVNTCYCSFFIIFPSIRSFNNVKIKVHNFNFCCCFV
jgi:hypothetical protein